MDALAIFTQADAWIALLTLAALEIVLGIDNIVFISILVAKLPQHQQGMARTLGLGLALASRLGLLFAINWIKSFTTPWFTLLGHAFSGRDVILGGGGLFLVAKATHEIFKNLELDDDEGAPTPKAGSLLIILTQIMLLDIVFSLDSVITAIGMANELIIMALAMIAAVIVMLVFARSIGSFILKHPSMKILALSFLLMIGVMLIAESFGQHIDKGYIYFAMGFSLLVELVNMRMRDSRRNEQAQSEAL